MKIIQSLLLVAALALLLLVDIGMGAPEPQLEGLFSEVDNIVTDAGNLAGGLLSGLGL